MRLSPSTAIRCMARASQLRSGGYSAWLRGMFACLVMTLLSAVVVVSDAEGVQAESSALRVRFIDVPLQLPAGGSVELRLDTASPGGAVCRLTATSGRASE